ncbi:MAG: D-glycero-beta-D-manno-heptose 1-phosphate adenylyltransferase [Candidatus Brocadiales bacterium]|nr:D-glycero-beta-D-manno-heptose 1-phosphate adenylyltransferase [Candidatus Brocadiales bacterium]
MNNRLTQILKEAQNTTIMVVGDLMLDKYVWGEVKRISPEAPIPIINVTQEETRPGGAGAVISNLIHLGARVLCSGVVGADPDGNKLLEILDTLGADTSGIFKDPERPTTIKTRMMGHLQTAGRGVQQLLRIDYEKTHPLPHEIEDNIIKHVKEHLSHCQLLAITDMNKGLLTERLLKALSSLGRSYGKPILVDPRLDSNCSLYSGVTAVTPNRYETELMTGINIASPESLRQAGAKLVKDLNLQYAIVTLDKDGIFLYERDGNCQLIPTNPREVCDVTGAGDMVLSMLALIVASGHSLVDAVRLANVAAGIEVGKIGALPVTKEEILKELSIEHPSLEKIKTLEEVEGVLKKHRIKKDRIVLTNGCFDILHVGHIEYLRFARSQGELLVVGINTDRSVRELKGPGRPVLSQKERARLLAALEDVDYVVSFDEPTPEKLIRRLRPDILIKGEAWKEKGVVGRELVESYGGKVILAPFVQGASTTDIISRIMENQKEPDPHRS